MRGRWRSRRRADNGKKEVRSVSSKRRKGGKIIEKKALEDELMKKS